jgi:hypothetical protein
MKKITTLIASVLLAFTAFADEIKQVGNHNYEYSPSTPLLTSTPYTIPKPTDSFYDADVERAIAEGKPVIRLFKAGVFQKYARIEPGNAVVLGERPANDRPRKGENTWAYIYRNQLEGVIGRYTIEIAANEPLLAEHPWLEPQPGDDLYDADKERAIANGSTTIARLYRRGVFIGYGTASDSQPRISV